MVYHDRQVLINQTRGPRMLFVNHELATALCESLKCVHRCRCGRYLIFVRPLRVRKYCYSHFIDRQLSFREFTRLTVVEPESDSPACQTPESLRVTLSSTDHPLPRPTRPTRQQLRLTGSIRPPSRIPPVGSGGAVDTEG